MLIDHSEILLGNLKEAVLNKSVIKFYYEDTNGKFKDYRTVEPYLIGVLKLNNELTLKGWFLPTGTQKALGQKEGWRLFHLKGIQNLEITRQNYKITKIRFEPRDKEMSSVICSTEMVK